MVFKEYKNGDKFNAKELNNLQALINEKIEEKMNKTEKGELIKLINSNIGIEIDNIQKELQDTINGTVLYENATGISGQGSLTLSELISKFSTIKIIYDISNDSNINNRYALNNIKEFDVSNSTEDLLISENINSPYYASISITGTLLEIKRNRIINNGAPSEGNYIIITKVIGLR